MFTREIRSRRRAVAAAGGDGTAIPDDMLSSLVLAEHDGRPFTEGELLPLLVLLLVGGIETTTSLIGSLVRRLLEAGLWESTVSDDGRLSSAVEESLRFDPPVLGLFRTARDDVEIHGEKIPAGAKVAGIFAAANRDPDQWSDPEEFKVGRSREELRRHLSFGVGIWLCPGAALARLEATVAVRVMAEKLPHLRLAGEADMKAALVTWGLRRLPIAWGSDAT